MTSDDRDAIDISVGEGIPRRTVMRQLGVAAGLGAFGGLAGCSAIQRGGGQSGGNNNSNGGSGNGDQGGSNQAPEYQIVDLVPPPTELNFTREPPQRNITMVTHDASTSFFVPTIAGLHDAARQTGWGANFTGPTSGFDVQQQVSLLESAVDSGPDVIATTIADANSYNNVIQRALDSDIPVVLYNTNAWTREQMRNQFGQGLAYTGQDQVAAGYVCGLTMLDKLPNDANTVTVGLSDPGHSALSARADGMEMAVKQNSNIQVTDRLNYTGDSNEGISRIENHLTSNPDLGGVMGADAFTWFIGEAINNQNATDSVVGGGFDLTEETLQFINDGVLKYTIGQDPYSQGYIPPLQMWEYLDRGIPAKDYPTGAEVIDESNIQFATQRSGGWGALRRWQQN